MTDSQNKNASLTNKSSSTKSLGKAQKNPISLKRKVKKKTFMQQYRYYQRRFQSTYRPTLNEIAINNFGYGLVAMFEEFDEVFHRNNGVTVHVRINWRFAASSETNWIERSESLNKMWVSWKNTTN